MKTTMKTAMKTTMKKQPAAKTPTKYDVFTITDLESQVEQMFTLSRESQKEMYFVLEYLRTTNRYKENSRYKKSSFWEYIDDRFTIRQGTYRENVRAFVKFSDFAVEYGTGIVTSIVNKCGTAKTKRVITEIQKEEEVHKRPITRVAIQKIIDKHAKPRIEKVITDWKSMYEVECIRHEATKINLKIALSKIDELQDQVAKLKSTAQKFNQMRKVFSGMDKVVGKETMDASGMAM